jgi:hypothetical protein
VLVVEPRSGNSGDEELAAIGARTRVGHRDSVRTVVSIQVMMHKLCYSI